MRILTIFGTRPEAIKLAPVVRALAADPRAEVVTCVTGQHRQMLDGVLQAFGIAPDHDLDIMRPNQTLDWIVSSVLTGAGALIAERRPDWVLVQGDTSTAFAGALAAFHAKVRVGHVEAGLRTGDLLSPWPEELNRRLVAQIAAAHFAPTPRAAANLIGEGRDPRAVLVTGNTVIDAMRHVVGGFDAPGATAAFDRRFGFLDPARRLVLVTGHRRENLDGGLAAMCDALAALAARPDVQIVYPVHLNPVVQETVRGRLAGAANVHLIPPLDYLPFLYLLRRCHLVITDSGGIQEEAPGLGKPVLVTRDTTERPEAVEAGTARLVGKGSAELLAAATLLLDDDAAHAAMAEARNPFGDGHAAERITEYLLQ